MGERYRNSVPNDAPFTAISAHISALQNQHAAMVDDMIASHLLFIPEIFQPFYGADGCVRTIIQLNDGRRCDVVTNGHTGETIVTGWTQT